MSVCVCECVSVVCVSACECVCMWHVCVYACVCVRVSNCMATIASAL